MSLSSSTYSMLRLTLLLLSLSSTFLMAQQDSLLVAATTAFDTQDYEQALDLYETIYSQDSTIQSLERAGLSASRLGMHPRARQHFLNLELRDSTSLIALTQLANLYEQEENIPKAIKYHTRLSRLYPDRGYHFRKLGALYKSAGLRSDAVRYYDQALKLFPQDLAAIRGLSELYLLDRQFVNADSMLRAGLAQDSLNNRLHLLMARSQFLQKAYDSTAYYMEQIRGQYVLKPHHERMLGHAYVQVDSFERAVYHLMKALTNDGSKEYVHYNLFVAHEALEDTESAKYHLQEAIKEGTSDDLDLYHRNLARLYNEEDNLKEAIPHYQDAYKYGEDPLVLFYLARASDVYYKDKNVAVRYYARFIKSGYDHPEYRDYSGKRMRYLKEHMHQGG